MVLQRFGGGAKSIKFDDALESSKFVGFPIHVEIGNTETTAVWSDDVCMFFFTTSLLEIIL